MDPSVLSPLPFPQDRATVPESTGLCGIPGSEKVSGVGKGGAEKVSGTENEEGCIRRAGACIGLVPGGIGPPDTIPLNEAATGTAFAFT